MTYYLPYKDRSLAFESVLNFVQPKGRDFVPPKSFITPVAALKNPIDSPTLSRLSQGAGRVVVVVPDATRLWQNVALMARAVKDELAGRPVTWVAATGQHRPVTDTEWHALLGDALSPADRLVSHCCDDTVDMGAATRFGTPVTLNPRVAQADLVVLVGGIVHHDMAGFSGGGKSLLPGVSGRESICINHNRCLTGDEISPLIGCGIVRGNPMIADIIDYLRVVGERTKLFCLNTVAGCDGTPVAWVAGAPVSTWKRGAAMAEEAQKLYLPAPAGRALVGVGADAGTDLYQATKAVSAVLDVLAPGAPLCLVAPCGDGAGPGAFAEDFALAQRDRIFQFEKLRRAFTIPAFVAALMARHLVGRSCALVTEGRGLPWPGPQFATLAEGVAWLEHQPSAGGIDLFAPSASTVHLVLRHMLGN